MSLRKNRLEITLFLVLFCSFAYFYQGGGANQNARLGQMRAIAERGQLHFKGIRVPSHDVVEVDGRIYPNKAPGMSLSGVVPYFLISRLKGTIIALTSEDFYYLLSCYLVTVLLVALPCALGGVVFFRLLGLFYAGAVPRLICTLGLFLGTPAFAYSTVLYGHMVSSVLTLISFYLLYKYLVHAPTAARGPIYLFLAGLSGGWAVVTEYPTIVIVSLLSLYCLLRSLFHKGGRPLRFGLFLAGLVIPACVLIVYNYLVFGNLFFVAYFDKRAAAHAAYRKGPLLGFQTAELVKALYQTSFGPFRGLFHISPFLILAVPGFYYFSKRKGLRGLLVTLTVLVTVYFFINSIYPYWYGGKALGPRHAMEMLPYLALLAFFFVVRFPRFSALLAALSIFFMLTAVSVRPEEYVAHPFRDLYFFAFFNGNLSINQETTFQTNSAISGYFNAFNLGEVAGLKGQLVLLNHRLGSLSLVPLYLIWLIGGITMTFYGKKEKNGSGPGYSGGVSSGLAKVAIGLLIVVLIVGVLNLLYQLQLKSYLEELSGAGEFRVSTDRAPVPTVQTRTSPGHRLQIWEVKKPYQPGDTLMVKLQHAAAGKEGGFYIVAYGDQNKDDKPDRELGRSIFLTARTAGDWSYWTFSAPDGKIFLGDTWEDGARVFFDRTGWKSKDFSPTMFYSQGGAPVLSTGPRSTNMTVEIEDEQSESGE